MYSTYESGDSGSIAPSPGQNVHNSTVCVLVCGSMSTPDKSVYFSSTVRECKAVCVCVCYLRSESGSGAGGADGSVAGEGDGQTSGSVLTGLILTHQPTLSDTHQRFYLYSPLNLKSLVDLLTLKIWVVGLHKTDI